MGEVGQQASTPVETQAPDDATDAHFDGLRVLLIDDDALILEGTRKLLQRRGCHVILALSGSDADALLEREAVLPDLVISDLRLDVGELGTEIVARIRRRYRPALPAVLMSGDTSLQAARFVRRHGLPLLYKPWPRHACARSSPSFATGRGAKRAACGPVRVEPDPCCRYEQVVGSI